VAGGIGIAPMLFLASHLNLKGFDLSDSTLFIGGRNKADLLCRKTFADFGMKVNVATDDGSDGKKGLVIDLLDLTDKKKRPDVIFACGPYAMLKAVAKLSEAHKILCQISIETIMACGMGACLGCAVETNDITDRYLHTCVDGPVFDSKIIKL
jgi:dihydroorotate dehydrogenase electron transfer subunit